MSHQIRASSFILLFFLSFLSSGNQAGTATAPKKTTSVDNKEKSVTGYRILADQDRFGKIDVSVTGDYGIATTGVAVGIHKTPFDKVYFVSRENKSILIWDTKKPYPLKSVFGTIKACQSYKRAGKTKYLGIDCDIIYGLTKTKAPVLKYTTTKSLPVPFSLKISQSQNLNCPMEYGYPLAVEYSQQLGGKIRWMPSFKTKKITKTTIPLSTFDVPTNYRKVKSVTELVFSSGGGLGKGDIEDLFEHHF
ncbi:MAG: hypothetical protein K8F91_09690 [Candidatus Obscuribacterales bacterium]|nr:hypothetical protein [Candidatus Obscuribacterales bacterium]